MESNSGVFVASYGGSGGVDGCSWIEVVYGRCLRWLMVWSLHGGYVRELVIKMVGRRFHRKMEIKVVRGCSVLSEEKKNE